MMRRRMSAAILCMVLCVTMMGAVTCYAAGSWSSEVTLTVPGLNASVNTKEDATVATYIKKATDGTTCSFYTAAVTGNLYPDARIINSNLDSRSNWARNLSTGTYKYATTTAKNGYRCYAEVSSDLAQVNTQSIRFKFSPDELTS